MAKINFPSSPSLEQTYTYLTQTWKWNGLAWEKSTATETGNTEGTTGGIAYYEGKSSTVKGALNAFYDETNERVGIGTSGPTELLHVKGGNIIVDGGVTADKLNIGDDGGFFTGSIKVDEAVRANEIIITNDGANTTNTWDATSLRANLITVDNTINGVTLGGGGATFGSHVGITGGLTADTIKVNGEAIFADSSRFEGAITATSTSRFEGAITATSTGDVTLTLDSDSDNSGENDNPLIRLTQDGGVISCNIGINGDANNQFAGALGNAFYIESESSYGSDGQIIQFATDNQDRMTILGNGNIGINTPQPQELFDVRGGITASNIFIASGVTFDCLVSAQAGLTADVVQVNTGIVGTKEIIGISIDNGSQVLTTGTKGHRTVPYAFEVTDWRVTSTDTGSITWGINYATYSNWPTATGVLIHTSEVPTITSSNKNESGGNISARWSPYQFAAGTYIQFDIDSVSDLTNVQLELTIRRI